jgi:predicted XRE-type DNA-binding protein
MDKDRKQQLVNLMSNYVDENNCIDISRFRTENPDEYALLPHYFGTVNNAVESNGWVKIIKTTGKEGQRVTLRNQLAYDMLLELRKNETLEQIAQKYGVTRPAVNQLFKALKSTINQQTLSE